MNEEQIKGVVEEIDAYLKKSSHWKESRILSVYRIGEIAEEMYSVNISHFGADLQFLRGKDGALHLIDHIPIYSAFPKPHCTPYEKGDA